MAIFYFEIRNDDGVTPDNAGHDLPDLPAARRLALEALGQIIINDGAKDSAGLKSVKVRDANGGVVFHVFANVVVATSEIEA